MEKFLQKRYRLIIFAILGFMLTVSIFNAKNDSATFDEIAHIPAGYSYLSQGEIRLNPEHPPLIKDLAGIPLAFMSLNFNVSQPFWTGELSGKWDEGQWEAGRNLLYESGNNADRIIFWSRIPIILISLLLGFFIFKWTRDLAGIITGLFALALYAFNPNILGHNHYVTTDIGIAAFITFAFYYFLRFIKRPSWKNVLLGGLFLGLLQLAKFSSIMVFPIFGIILTVYPLIKKLKENESKDKNTSSFSIRLKILGEYLGKGVLAFLFSLIIVWIAYFANTFNMNKETMSQIIDFNFPESQNDNVKNLYTNKALHLLNENSVTRPLSSYGIGIGYVFRRVAGGNGAYFMGQVSNQGIPAYFPVVYLLKEPLVSLFLVFTALLLALTKTFRSLLGSARNYFKDIFHKSAEYLRKNTAVFSMFLFVLLYSCISVTGNLNIGLRHLFPIFPFIFILTAKTISDFIKNQKEKNRKLLGLLTGVTILILFLGTVSAYPYYLSYFNQLAGGPENGYRYVTDSNADWGQDLKRLKIFLEKNPEIKPIRIDYFGGGNLDYYFGKEGYVPWHDSKRPIESGWYAISTNFLQGSTYDQKRSPEETYNWLKKIKPRFQVGTSILIYQIDKNSLEIIKTQDL